MRKRIVFTGLLSLLLPVLVLAEEALPEDPPAFVPELWKKVWEWDRTPEWDSYFGLETVFWKVDFAEKEKDWFDPTPPAVSRDPYFFAVSRLSLRHLFGFDFHAELKLSGLDSWDQLFTTRSFSLGLGAGGASLKARFSRNLGLLAGPLSFISPVSAENLALLQIFQLDYQGVSRRFNWKFQKNSTTIVGLDGRSTTSTGALTLPADTSEHRFGIKAAPDAQFLFGTEFSATVTDDFEIELEGGAAATMWPSLGIYGVVQEIVTPMDILVSNYFIYLDGGVMSYSEVKTYSATFLTKNRFSGLGITFKTFDLDSALPWYSQPIGVNFQWDGAFGEAQLETGFFESEGFSASRNDITLEVIVRPRPALTLRTGGFFAVYDYTPIEVILNNKAVIVTRDYTAGSLSFVKGERLGLDFFRGETFFGFFLEGAWRF